MSKKKKIKKNITIGDSILLLVIAKTIKNIIIKS